MSNSDRRWVSYFSAVACFAASLLLVLYAWWPLTSAQWSIVDDHEIVATASSLNGFSYIDIPAALELTEVSSDSAMTRFRPSYYVLRFAEIATWGAQPQYWYMSRIALFVAFALSFTWLCLRIAPPLLTLGFVVFVFSRPFWVDIFARLGPAEAYGALGLTLILIGVLRALKRQWGILECLALASGVIISSGSKENFLFLAIVPFGVLIWQWRALRWVTRCVLSLPVIFAIWVAATILTRVGRQGKDIYAQDVSLDSRLSLLIDLIARPEVWAWLAGVVMILAYIVFLEKVVARNRAPVPPSFQKKLWLLFWLMTGLFLVYSMQYVFYAGRWPELGNPRYLFPGILAKYLAMLVFAVFAHDAIQLATSRRWVSRVFAVIVSLLFLGIVQFPRQMDGGLFAHEVKILKKGFLPDLAWNRASAKKVVDESSRFSERIATGVAALKEQPSMAVIFNTHTALDYELVFSVERYIRAAGVQASIAVRLDGFGVDSFPDDALARELTQVLDDIRSGRKLNQKDSEQPAHLQNLFVPLEQVDLSAGCLSYGFSGPAFAGCQQQIQIFP